MSLSAVFSPATHFVPSEESVPLKKRSFSVIDSIIMPAIAFFTGEASLPKEKGSIECLSAQEKKEMISSDSVLPKASASSSLSSRDLTVLGQIHGNSISGSTFERCGLEEGVEALEKLLRFEKEIEIPKQLYAALHQLKNSASEMRKLARNLPESKSKCSRFFYEHAKEMMSHVYRLSNGSSYFVEGKMEEDGVEKEVVYEFTRTSENTFDLHVYIAGRVEEAFREESYCKGKTRIRPIIHFQNIPEAELFFNTSHKDLKPDFFQALLTHSLLTQTNDRYSRIDSSPKYIMLHLLGHLQKYRAKSSKEDPFMALSRSRRETWDVLRAVLIRHLGKSVYKQLIVKCKFASLMEGYTKLPLHEDSSNAEMARSVFKAGAKGLLRSIESLERQKLSLGVSFVRMVHATALDMLEKIESAEKEIARARTSREKKLKLKPNESPSYKPDVQNAKKSMRKIAHSYESIQTRHATFIDLSSLEPLGDGLIQSAVVYQKIKNVKHIHALEIEHLAHSLPIPKLTESNELWDAIPKEQLQEVVSALQTLMYTYQQGMESANRTVTPKEANTVFALYATMHYLAIRYEKECLGLAATDLSSLAYYPLFMPGMDSDKDPLQTYASLEEYERRQAIIEYFKSTYTCAQNKSESKALFNLGDEIEVHTDRTSTGLAAYLVHIDQKARPCDKTSIGMLRNVQELVDELSYKSKHILFEKYNYQHVPKLAHAASIAHLFGNRQSVRLKIRDERELKYKTLKVESTFSEHKRESSSEKWGYVSGTFRIGWERFRTWGSEGKYSSDSLHPKLGKNYHKLLKDFKWSKRKRTENTSVSEAEVLSEKTSVETAVDSKEFLLASCEPNLFPHKLLSYYRSHIHLLVSPEEQTLFEVSLFRSILIEGSSRSISTDREPYELHRSLPFAEEMTQNEFLKIVEGFIQAGIGRYYTRQPKKRADVFGVLFFFRLALRTAKFTKEPLGIDVAGQLKSILAETKDLTIEEKSALNLHLILAYTNQKEPLSSEQVEELFGAWVYYKNTPLPEKWQNPSLELEAEDFIHHQCNLLGKSSEEFQKKLLESTFEQMGLGSLSEACEITSTGEFPHMITAEDEERTWEINVLTGQVRSEDGVFNRVKAPDWIRRSPFSRVLGEGDYSFLKASDVYYFTHPKLGVMRISYSDGGWSGRATAIIERQINRVWYQYFSPSTYYSSLPECFVKGHTHWVSSSLWADKILIADQESGKTVATLSKEALILADGKTEVLPIRKSGISEAFAPSEFMYLTRNEEESTEALTFPLYETQSRQTLNFALEKGGLEEENRYVYTQNRKYFLGAQTAGLLGGDKDYLLLTHIENGSHKMLVPLRELPEENPLSTTHITRSFSSKSEQTVLEYNIKDGELVPLSQEGTLYLAYRCLSQREYLKAANLLHQIDFREPLSAKSIDILKWLTDYSNGSLSADPSPESTAVSMHALMLVKKANIQAKKEGRKGYSGFNSHKGLQENYLRYCHMIPRELLIYKDEMDLIEGKLLKSSSTAYPLIQRYVSTPYGSITPVKFKLEYDYRGLELQPETEENKWENNAIKHNRKGVVRDSRFLDRSNRLAFDGIYAGSYSLVARWNEDFEATFFTPAYQIAKYGTEIEKKQLAFRLQVVHALYGERSVPSSWTILQFALLHPEAAPDIPKDLEDIPARWEFLQTLSKKMKEHEKAGSKSDPTIDTPISELPTFTPRIAEGYLPTKEVKEVESPLKLEPLLKESVDGGWTTKKFEEHFEPKEAEGKVASSVDLVSEHKPSFPKKGEKAAYQPALDKDFKLFIVDLEEGVRINDKRTSYHLEDVESLDTSLGERIKDLDTELHDLKECILELANKQDPESKEKKLLVDIGVDKEITFNQLVDLFLKGDKEQFAAANPYLRNEALIKQLAKQYSLDPNVDLCIDYLYNLVGLYMTTHVHRSRLQRAKGWSNKILKSEEKSLTRDALVQKLAEELVPQEKPAYAIHEYPIFLVFEFLSGLSLYEDQARLLTELLTRDKNGNYINRVIQLIMGRGKTSVLAVILLKEAARKGCLSLFVTPASQYATVSHNLRSTLRDYFDQEMEEIDVTREQLTLEMCLEIEERLKRTIAKGDFLLVKAETLQGLQLAFLDLVNQAYEAEEVSETLLKQINTLRRTLLIFKEQGNALLDEVDLLLNVLQEVNFPTGEAKHIAAERIEVIREMFRLFASDNVEIREGEFIDLEKLVGLRANRQNLMRKEAFYGDVAEAIAYNLSRNMHSLRLSHRKDLYASFRRYIDGTMSIKSQKQLLYPNEELEMSLTGEERDDVAFLQHIIDLRKSKEPADVEAAHQIALIKHMMQKVLPVTFGKVGKRHYGRGGEKPGEIRPYEAVFTPSRNLIGYHWEAVAYHFQTALQCGISKEQLLEVAKLYQLQAEIQSEKDKIPVDETLEAVEFQSLSGGVALYDLDNPEKLALALKNLNENLEALLRIEADTASEYVTYYPHRLTSTGQMLIDSLATTRAMSGTPWNVPCYEDSLAENFLPGLGTEGQIADKVLQRIASKKEEKNYVHIVDSEELDGILGSFLDKHPQKERVQMVMDAGAQFKDFSNLDVAKGLRKKLNKPVLFFMRDPLKNEKTPDTLALLKIGSDIPVIIGGTRLEDIETTGLELEDYVVFADERHTTGTDLPLIPDAIGVMTLDESMLRRGLFQTIMRLRGLFLHQDVEFLIPAHLLPILGEKIGEEIENKDLKYILAALILSIENQAAAKAKHYFRSCKQKIDNIFRQKLLSEEGLLCKKELTHLDIKHKFRPYREITLINQCDEPFDQFWGLEDNVDSYESLKAYRKRRLKLFDKLHEDYAAIKGKTKLVVQKAELSPYRPITVREMGTEDLGSQLEMNIEVAAEVDEQVEQDVSEELINELQMYRGEKYRGLRPDKQWGKEEISSFLLNLQIGKSAEAKEAMPLQTLFGSKHYRYKRDFSSVFHAPIHVTTSWAYTTDSRLPIFHDLQRPLGQLLVTYSKKNGHEAIALSQNEAKQFKAFLHENYASGKFDHVWLIHPDGTLYEENSAFPLPNPKDTPELQNILVECHVFNGRIDALDAVMEPSMEWLYADKESVERKKEFLQMRIVDDKTQKKLFFVSDVFGDPIVTANKRKMRSRRIAEKLGLAGEEEIQALTKFDRGIILMLAGPQLNMLHPDQVPLISPIQVADLEKPELIRAIPEKYAENIQMYQMEHIGGHQVRWFEENVAKTQSISVTLLKDMSEKQLAMIGPQQIRSLTTFEQVQCLVDGPSQLQHITGEQVKADLVSEKQIQYLRQPGAIAAIRVPWLGHVYKSLRQRYLCEDQVSRLDPETQEELIRDLTIDQVKWLVSEEQLRCLTKEQFAWLSAAQIETIIRSKDLVARLSNEQIAHIHPDAVQHIENGQIQYLSKIGQVRVLTPDRYRHIADAQARLLEDEDFEIMIAISKELRQTYLRKAHAEQLHPVDHNQQIKDLTEAQVKWLVNEDQLRVLEKGQFGWLSPAQIETIIRSKDLVDRLSNLQIAHIHPDAVQHIEDEQIQYLSKIGQVRVLTPDRYPHIADAQASLLEDEDFEIMIAISKGLRQTYLRKAHAEQLDPLAHAQQIKDLTEAQVKWLVNEGQLRVLEKGQFGWLSPAQIETIIRSKDLVDRLSNEQIAHIHPDAVQHIKDEQIQYLSKILQVRVLTPERYPHLADGQAKLLEDEDFAIMIAINKDLRQKYLRKAHAEKLDPETHKQQIEDLTEAQVPYLINEEQLNVLIEEQIPWISDDQVRDLVRSEELFKRLVPKQMAFVDPQFVHLVPDTSIQYFKRLDQVRALAPKRYNHLTDVQAALLEDEDFEIMLALKTELRQTYMRKAHVEQLDPHKHLTHIQELTETQVKHLRSEEQIQVLRTEQVDWLSGLQIQELVRSRAMVERLAPEQLNRLDTDVQNRMRSDRNKQIAILVAGILAALVAAAALIVGAFAVMGAHASFAPQFMVSIYQGLGSSNIAAYALTAGGGVVLLGLTSYAVYRCCTRRTGRRGPILPGPIS